ncbi:bifunctional phosphatase PAP2/diacylglycerol kinase family protein [Glutamicibacter mishrai]|uniref:Diacylglycerol kinase family lipid kinase n=1 Tax=Glutamicibacter mishrai TaxID=1775880 RepID=A0A6H0SGT4_9MICC|nr:bifunctional phosphatase PAP2/diacylglycerol kinase family protein [Glutamicibacter mishrai]QIV86862.1 diacylglycerol kinase family lipid kinase [Glutamicibacter mishrai]
MTRILKPLGRFDLASLAQGRFFMKFIFLFTGWTLLSTVWGLEDLDELTLAPWINARSFAGQIAEAFALLTHPALVFAFILAMALWTLRRRIRRLAGALGAVAFVIPITAGIQFITNQPRPASPFEDSLTYQISAYPSAHMVAVSVLAWVLATLGHAQRLTTSSALRSRLIATLLILMVLGDQWIMRTQTTSQLIGGVLLGITWASGVLVVTGVGPILQGWAGLGLPVEQSDKRAAVIYNPTKVLDFALFRRRVEYELQAAGWKPPLWLETERENPGGKMSQQAIDANVDVVIVAGGDGTVRMVCQELANQGIPVAPIPAGTGNLLARNLGASLDESEAIRTALAGEAVPIDLISCTTEAGNSVCAVMCGLGFDAKIMGNTNPELKKTIKAVAYVVAAAQQFSLTPFECTLTIDDQPIQHHSSIMTLIGNVGRLMGGINLIPSAVPTDGKIDAMIASPTGARELASIARGIVLGTDAKSLSHQQGQVIEIRADQPVACQLDGDYAGESTFFRAEIMPQALSIMLDAGGPRPWQN